MSLTWIFIFQFQCCGILSPSDYDSSEWSSQQSSLSVPLTCCSLLNSQVYKRQLSLKFCNCIKKIMLENILYLAFKVNNDYYSRLLLYTSENTHSSSENNSPDKNCFSLGSDLWKYFFFFLEKNICLVVFNNVVTLLECNIRASGAGCWYNNIDIILYLLQPAIDQRQLFLNWNSPKYGQPTRII